MPTQPHRDANLTRMLTQVSAFQHWQHQPLAPELARQLNAMDQQTLMTLAAEALHRLLTETPDPPPTQP
jgi:hypothetical protein